MNEYKTEITEFKGNKVFTIFKGEHRIFGFGLKKAKAILACVELIKLFVASNDDDSQHVDD